MATAITAIEPGALHRLLAWLSPAYPVGGFSYSHGLEAAVEEGSVRNRAGLVDYVAAVLRAGAGRVDGALLVAAWRAAEAGDDAALDDAAVLAAAWRGTAETALESLQQGAAFAAVTQAAWPDARFVFLAPPSWEELERRLVGRGTEGPEERARRLETAKVELAAEPKFDVTIVNDEVHRATDELVALMGLRTR